MNRIVSPFRFESLIISAMKHIVHVVLANVVVEVALVVVLVAAVVVLVGGVLLLCSMVSNGSRD